MSGGEPGRRPLVAVTTYHRDASGRERFSLPSAYVDAVREVGAIPVLVAPGEAAAEELLRRVDGLVLSGGGDLDPKHSGGSQHPTNYSVSSERDELELALLRGALACELPVLAICRGMQVLNVALGGDIHPHLPDLVGESVPHRLGREAHIEHAVELEANSRLAELLGAAALAKVSSWHHQAVRRLGSGLRAVAWAADGIVEAIELEGAPQVLAVQWHPELDRGVAAHGTQLFEELARQARRRAR